LLLASYERRIETPGVGRCVRTNRIQAPRVRDSLRLNGVTHEPVGLVAEENAANRRTPFELRCHAGDRTGNVQCFAGCREHVHLARAEADARFESTIRETCQCLLDLPGG